MAEILKPVDINKIWSASGDILAPSDTKISQGWGVEIPPRQWFNYIDNKQDQAIAHINQYGIALWDGQTEYQYSPSGAKSLVMGSNGSVYRTKQTNTNQNPVNDMSSTYWEVAFSSLSDVYTKAQVDSKTTIATTAQAQAQSNNTSLLTPQRLFEAFQGGNQQQASSGYQKLPGGLIIQWGQTPGTDATGYSAQNLPITFPVAHFQAVCVYASGSRNSIVTQIASLTTTQIQVFASTTSTGAAVSGALVKWIAIGV